MPKANNGAGSRTLPNLNRLAYFAAVVEAGSFTAAAERLGVTKAVVSQQVARLEREAGVSLLVRSTRRVRATRAGELFHARCQRILHATSEAFEVLADAAATPSGTLRLAAPFDYGIGVLAPAIAEFARRHPRCRVEALFGDQRRDVLADDIDLAIRVGWLTEGAAQARRIGGFHQRLVAAPALAEALGAQASPEDLAALPFVANAALRDPLHWAFAGADGARRAVTVQAAIVFDATLAVRAAVVAGAGASVLPDYVVADDLAQGRLVHLLPGWSLPEGGIHAVFPPARYRPTIVRAFVDLLREGALADGG